MEREQKQTEHVEAGHKIILEPINHHRIDIIMAERIGFEQSETPIRHSHSEMGEVINDEREHDETAHQHVARRKCCLHIVSVDVGVWPGAPVLNCQLDRYPDVNNNRDKQEQTNRPQQRAKIAQVLRVTVDPIGSEKNLQIPEQMSYHKQD